MSEPRIRIENVLRDYAEMNPETFYRSRCEKEAADEIQSLRQRVERLEGELDAAWEHLTLVLSCDPGPKLLAAREDASRWAMAYDKAKEAALGGHSEQI